MTWKWDEGHVLTLVCYLIGFGSIAAPVVGHLSPVQWAGFGLAAVFSLVGFFRKPPVTLDQAVAEGESDAVGDVPVIPPTNADKK